MTMKEIFLLSKDVLDEKMSYMKKLEDNKYLAVRHKGQNTIQYTFAIKNDEIEILDERTA